jgi:hypothetical protein
MPRCRAELTALAPWVNNYQHLRSYYLLYVRHDNAIDAQAVYYIILYSRDCWTCRWPMWLREPVLHGLRHQHGSAEHSAVQQRPVTCDHEVEPYWCKPSVTVTISATNFCPPNWALPSDNGGWCNPPRLHFDMSQPAWELIGVYRRGIIPVLYQRLSLLLVSKLRDSSADWTPMAHNRGAHWHALVTDGQTRVPECFPKWLDVRHHSGKQPAVQVNSYMDLMLLLIQVAEIQSRCGTKVQHLCTM